MSKKCLIYRDNDAPYCDECFNCTTHQTPQQNTQLSVDEILKDCATPDTSIIEIEDNIERAKPQLLSLIMGVIGEDEYSYSNYDSWSAMRKNSPMNVRDRLRAEQRLKAQQLFNPKKGE